eukprot:jgi/Chlat1/5049/Chrsp33S00382
MEAPVLLTVKARYQAAPKGPRVPGVLMLTAAKVSWTPNDPSSAQPVRIPTDSVVSIKVSAASAAGLFAKLCSTPDPKGPGSVFELFSPADRDQLSTVLGQLLTKRKGNGAAAGSAATPPGPAGAAPPASETVSADVLEKRAKLLAANRELASLHQKLVGTGVLTEMEFWQSRQDLLKDKNAKAGLAQRTGMPNAMLADVRPTSDGRRNAVSFKLTPEVIHQIFAEKPAVHRAYLANVPHKMDEKEFWTKYFKYEYFNRARHGDVDDEHGLFGQGQEEEAALAEEARRKVQCVEPSVNLAADDNAAWTPSEGYGIRHNVGKDVDKSEKAVRFVIRDINRHAEVVLKGRPAGTATDSASLARALAAQSNCTTDGRVPDEKAVAQWHHRMQEEIEMPDLQGDRHVAVEPLRIQDPRRYFELGAGACSTAGPQAVGRDAMGPDDATAMQDLNGAIQSVEASSEQLHAIDSELAAKVLGEVSHQISQASKQGHHGTSVDIRQLPQDIQNELFDAAATSQELLRHFWQSYPIRSQLFREKVNRLKDAMSALYDRLQLLRDRTPSEHRHTVSQLLNPILQSLDAAFVKYEAESQPREQAPMQSVSAATSQHSGMSRGNGSVAASAMRT